MLLIIAQSLQHRYICDTTTVSSFTKIKENFQSPLADGVNDLAHFLKYYRLYVGLIGVTVVHRHHEVSLSALMKSESR